MKISAFFRWVGSKLRICDRYKDPLDDPEYQRFLAETANTCHAEDPPCDSCCAGGVCDGPRRYRDFEDAVFDDHYDFDDYNDDMGT